MSEPITLYDRFGAPFITHSPSVAQQAIAAGMLFTAPPALPEPTPNDTQEAPTVGKPRRGKAQGAK